MDGEVLAVRVSWRLAVELEKGQYRLAGARREKCQNTRSRAAPAGPIGQALRLLVG